jgi:hypothetical protein
MRNGTRRLEKKYATVNRALRRAYYLASEVLGLRAGDIHTAFDLAMPVLILAHVRTGRRKRA